MRDVSLLGRCAKANTPAYNGWLVQMALRYGIGSSLQRAPLVVVVGSAAAAEAGSSRSKHAMPNISHPI